VLSPDPPKFTTFDQKADPALLNAGHRELYPVSVRYVCR